MTLHWLAKKLRFGALIALGEKAKRINTTQLGEISKNLNLSIIDINRTQSNILKSKIKFRNSEIIFIPDH